MSQIIVSWRPLFRFSRRPCLDLLVVVVVVAVVVEDVDEIEMRLSSPGEFWSYIKIEDGGADGERRMIVRSGLVCGASCCCRSILLRYRTCNQVRCAKDDNGCIVGYDVYVTPGE
jgi:hypothetical protein